MLAERGVEKGGKVQKYIDTTVVVGSATKVPLRMTLKKARHYGSGEVRYNTPYAELNYYSNRGAGVQGTEKGGQRGKQWFERMKADDGGEILRRKWQVQNEHFIRQQEEYLSNCFPYALKTYTLKA